MNIDAHMLQSLGWALLHSLWQSVFVFLLYVVASRTFGSESNRRYFIASGAITVIPMAFAITFLVLLQRAPQDSVSTTEVLLASSDRVFSDASTGMLTTVSSFLSWIDLHLSWGIR